MKRLLFILIFALSGTFVFGQRVGLVFSGGGATGFAHIGVLKALEEHDIPIDYITGTSAGALVGAMYASGFSPKEIELIALSDKFQLMSNGDLEEKHKYFINQEDEDAELVSYRFDKDSLVKHLLPTNLLNPTFLDLEMVQYLGRNPESAEANFDSLFVPFRCIASNIATKESISFSSGNLNQVVRASMTYPFFLSPIEIDGQLLFDGGLYNNFPANEMYYEFDPDFIIGSNVSYNEPPPSDDDVMSQVRNMFSTHSDYTLPCTDGIIIEPDLGDEVGTFEFDKIKRAIDIGYAATIAKIDSIKMFVSLRVSQEERRKSREIYRSRMKPIEVSEIEIVDVKSDEINYFKKKLIKTKGKKPEVIDFSSLEYRYLRLFQSEQVQSMFPTIEENSDSTYKMTVSIKKKKPLRLAFGGHYSSRPVNTGFLSLSYSDFRITPLTVYANAYFGKFYGSVKAGLKVYLPSRTTSYIEPIFVMNRWDYFRSFATFFEDVRPSYLIQNERFWSLRYHFPAGARSKITVDFTNGTNENRYYQTDNFTNLDTADYTSFLYYSPGIEYTMNKLNRKQWASAGSRVSFKSRFIHGIEHAVPGSTSANKIETNVFRNWVYLEASYLNYFMKRGAYRLGIYLEGAYSFQPFFSNYTSSLLMSHSFQPTPDSQTGFYNDFRSNKYTGGGLINIFTFKDMFDIRLEAYVIQPFYRILDDNGTAREGELFDGRFGMASASIIYHSLIGPLRATLNYIPGTSILEPLNFQVSFGYVLFNNRALQ